MISYTHNEPRGVQCPAQKHLLPNTGTELLTLQLQQNDVSALMCILYYVMGLFTVLLF